MENNPAKEQLKEAAKASALAEAKRDAERMQIAHFRMLAQRLEAYTKEREEEEARKNDAINRWITNLRLAYSAASTDSKKIFLDF